MTNKSSEELQNEVDEYYRHHYGRVHSSGTLGAANNFFHKSLERNRAGKEYPITLELGAGNFEHVGHVTHKYDKYICVDIRQPTPEVLRRLEAKKGQSFTLGDATKIPFPDNFADRIVVTCLIMHLADPLAAINEWQRVCKPGGIIDLLVPTDPGMAIRVFRKLVSERRVASLGISKRTYRLVNAYEHISSFDRIKKLVSFAIEDSRQLSVTYYPLRFVRSFNVNAFAIFTISPEKRNSKRN